MIGNGKLIGPREPGPALTAWRISSSVAKTKGEATMLHFSAFISLSS